MRCPPAASKPATPSCSEHGGQRGRRGVKSTRWPLDWLLGRVLGRKRKKSLRCSGRAPDHSSSPTGSTACTVPSTCSSSTTTLPNTSSRMPGSTCSRNHARTFARSVCGHPKTSENRRVVESAACCRLGLNHAGLCQLTHVVVGALAGTTKRDCGWAGGRRSRSGLQQTRWKVCLGFTREMSGHFRLDLHGPTTPTSAR